VAFSNTSRYSHREKAKFSVAGLWIENRTRDLTNTNSINPYIQFLKLVNEYQRNSVFVACMEPILPILYKKLKSNVIKLPPQVHVIKSDVQNPQLFTSYITRHYFNI